MKKQTIIVVVGIIIGIGLLYVGANKILQKRPEYTFIQGEIDATRIDIASKISGRVHQVLVQDGMFVNATQTLIVLDSPEIDAKVRQVEAAREASLIRLQKFETGSRVEEILQAETAVAEAKAARKQAESTLSRIENLHAARAISTQDFENAKTNLRVSEEREKRAQSALDMLRSGVRPEDKAEQTAVTHQVLAQLAEAEALQADISLHAPIDAEVNKVLVRPGELIGAGSPLVTLIDMKDLWLTVQIREDLLQYIRMGEVVTAMIPALGDKTVDFKVTYISPLGDFATWRASNNAGSFDLKTFEVQGRPLEPVEGLRPGMSVIIPVNQLSAKNSQQK